MDTVRITCQRHDIEKIQRLYVRAFPENERRPLEPLLEDATGCADVLAFYDGDLFCGFACLLTYGDLTHILYIAIDEALRGRGYGTRALEAIRAFKPGRRILADLEAERPDAPNNAQRRRRRAFYGRNGYAASPVAYAWRGEDYEIFVQGGSCTEEEFEQFWHFFDTENTRLSKY